MRINHARGRKGRAMTKRKAPEDRKPPGRHTVDPSGPCVAGTVTLPPRHWAIARRLDPRGEDNASAGVRVALDKAAKHEQHF
jgi:hypothetical protein